MLFPAPAGIQRQTGHVLRILRGAVASHHVFVDGNLRTGVADLQDMPLDADVTATLLERDDGLDLYGAV